MSPKACIAPKAFGIAEESGRESGGTADLSIERLRIDRERVGIGYVTRIVDEEPRLLHRIRGKKLEVLLLDPDSGKRVRHAAIAANFGERLDEPTSRLLWRKVCR